MTNVLLLLALFFLYIPIPWVTGKLMRKKFLKDVQNNGNILLTFDDGPSPESTREILRILNEFDISAIFFLLGEKAERYPDIVNEIISAGHYIGEHSYYHSHPWKSNPLKYAQDLIKSDKLIRKLHLSQRSIFFRPPYGKFNLITLIYIIMTNKKTIFWNIDPKDYNNNSHEDVVQTVLNQLKAGSIVLFHDGRMPGGKCSDANTTVRALESILKKIFYNKKSYTIIRNIIIQKNDFIKTL